MAIPEPIFCHNETRTEEPTIDLDHHGPSEMAYLPTERCELLDLLIHIFFPIITVRVNGDPNNCRRQTHIVTTVLILTLMSRSLAH